MNTTNKQQQTYQQTVIIFVNHTKLDQILGLNRSARLNGDTGFWTSQDFDLCDEELSQNFHVIFLPLNSAPIQLINDTRRQGPISCVFTRTENIIKTLQIALQLEVSVDQFFHLVHVSFIAKIQNLTGTGFLFVQNIGIRISLK